ncbi:MAG TPA: 50S ribosomal protein L32 [Calditrichia bacterium]|nr:50S ribosomal protein L32 [Calditrichota bacterium]HQU72056.1 50S ribosomal protein L32 [Calditrichia bacterium]HQV32759.1 50S ribosomal protein L32 [Calditrichia bacterium]
MANPKRKISRSKRDMRRANWLRALVRPALVECSNCGEPRKRHYACPSCGYYNGQLVKEE